MLSRSMQVAIPTAAPGAVLASIAEELKRNGCTIRTITAGSVEFWGPEELMSLSRKRQRASLVSEGVVRLDGTGGTAPVRVGVRLRVLPMIWGIVAGVLLVATDMHVAIRAILLVMVAAVMWVQVDDARSEVEDWVASGVRKAG